MTTSLTLHHVDVTTILGNRCTLFGETFSSTGLGTLTVAALANIEVDLAVAGNIQGILRYEFADPETLEGMLTPADLRTAQIQLTQANAGASLALIAEEIFGY